MAWLWKQGRPTLLTLAGLGFLGYTVLHKEREPVGPGQAGAGVRRAVTAGFVANFAQEVIKG
jgi:hypothetical protein